MANATPAPARASASLDVNERFAAIEQATKAYDDARQHPRIPFRGRAIALVFPPPGSPPDALPVDSEVVTSDLSRGGVSIMHATELYPGQKMQLLLSEGSRLVEVRWCCRVWDGLYMGGCQFIDGDMYRPLGAQAAAIDLILSSDFWTEL